MFYKLLIVGVILMFSACGGGSNQGDPELPVADEAVDESTANAELETVVYDDKGTLHVITNITSAEDLEAYKTQKVAEAEKILEDTVNESADKPYYPVVITMNKPISFAQMRRLLGKYNPTVAKTLKTNPLIKYLPKAAFVKNEDTLMISSVKFASTEGGGQLSYDTLTHDKEISKLEKEIAFKEKELNGIDNYQLFKGITSVSGGIHRDSVLPIQKDSSVFLADIGPAEMYKAKPESALWDDVYKDVEEYSK